MSLPDAPPAPAAELRTARLVMRRARPEDVDALHRIMADPEVMRFWSTPPHRSLDETRRWLQPLLAFDPAQSDEFMLEEAGELIGKLGAWRWPEIGFLIRRDRWGQGLAGEALTAFASYAAARGHGRLTADVDPLNAGCLRTLERAGFRETGRARGTFEVGGRLCDSVYLELELGG